MRNSCNCLAKNTHHHGDCMGGSRTDNHQTDCGSNTDQIGGGSRTDNHLSSSLSSINTKKGSRSKEKFATNRSSSHR
jgi:hypothetical protein